ncbi:MAG: hypothetical protein HQ519_03855 [Planctomycetes bacterium]|nr:hypothetical protein [Planctomycetota bacterium]
MKYLFLASMVFGLTAAAGAQNQVAPLGQPNSINPNISNFNSGGQHNQATVSEDFETYIVGASAASTLGVLALDDTTISASGQGPNLVQDGVSYFCTGGSMQWNGPNYYGLITKTLMANTIDGDLWLGYDSPQSSVSFSLSVFSGYPDVATIFVYNTSGALLHSSGPISIPGPTPVPFSFSGSNIGLVSIDGTSYSWSPCIDQHAFSGGLSLTSAGTPGGSMTFDVSGATNNGPVALIYAFGLGNHSATNPITGNTLVTGLSSTGFTLGFAGPADGSGNMSHTTFVPGAAAGLVAVQAIDLLSDGLSNVVSL